MPQRASGAAEAARACITSRQIGGAGASRMPTRLFLTFNALTSDLSARAGSDNTAPLQLYYVNKYCIILCINTECIMIGIIQAYMM